MGELACVGHGTLRPWSASAARRVSVFLMTAGLPNHEGCTGRTLACLYAFYFGLSALPDRVHDWRRLSCALGRLHGPIRQPAPSLREPSRSAGKAGASQCRGRCRLAQWPWARRVDRTSSAEAKPSGADAVCGRIPSLLHQHALEAITESILWCTSVERIECSGGSERCTALEKLFFMPCTFRSWLPATP